jgi:hypothetical protein
MPTIDDDDARDDALLAELRRVAAEADPVPGTVLAAAAAAIEFRDLDAALAALVADSAQPADRDDLATVRGAPADAAERMLLYNGGGVTIDLAVEPGGGALTVIGRITGAVAGSCTLESTGEGLRPLDTDELGRFVRTGLAPGPMRLRCRTTGGDSLVTEWVNL